MAGARLIVLCGLPGSGKTTFARRLEREVGAVRLCPDEWLAALGIDLFDEVARARVEALQWQLARRLLLLGQVVAIEWGTWGRSERDLLRTWCREQEVAVELRFLDAPLDELVDRVATRSMEERCGSVPLTRADLVRYRRMLEPPDDDELALYDPPPL